MSSSKRLARIACVLYLFVRNTGPIPRGWSTHPLRPRPPRHARDPAVRAVLETLAREEAQHAEHAWRTVAWALAKFGKPARDAMQAEVTALEAQASVGDLPGADPDRDALLAHGILTEDLRNAIRRSALGSLIVPLATAVLESQHRGPSARAANRALNG